MAEPTPLALVRPKIPTSGPEKPSVTPALWRSEYHTLTENLVTWKREANERERALGKPRSEEGRRVSFLEIETWERTLAPEVRVELVQLHRQIHEGDNRAAKMARVLERYDNPGPLLERVGVMREHQNATLEDWPDRADMLREWINLEAVDARSSCILVNGPVGTGKSRLAVAILAEVLRVEEHTPSYVPSDRRPRGERARFVLARRLLNELWRDTSASDGGGAMDTWARTRWLVIDDLGHEGRVSEAGLGAFHELLSLRCGNYERTVVTTNLSLEEIGAAYDPSIASRLAGWTQIVLTGPDRRRQ